MYSLPYFFHAYKCWKYSQVGGVVWARYKTHIGKWCSHWTTVWFIRQEVTSIWPLLHYCAHSNTFTWCPCSHRVYYVLAWPSVQRYNWSKGRLASLALVASQSTRRITLTLNSARWSLLTLSCIPSSRSQTLSSNPQSAKVCWTPLAHNKPGSTWFIDSILCILPATFLA